ncbi:MAG: hypothetical protein P8X74_19840 [Reinekea sp.]
MLFRPCIHIEVTDSGNTYQRSFGANALIDIASGGTLLPRIQNSPKTNRLCLPIASFF